MGYISALTYYLLHTGCGPFLVLLPSVNATPVDSWIACTCAALNSGEYDTSCSFNERSKADTSQPWASAHRGKWGQLSFLEKLMKN